MAGSMLAQMARDMQFEVLRRGSSERELGRGLRMVLVDNGGMMELRLSRPAVAVGEMEVTICRRAFEVPETAERSDVGQEVVLRWLA